MALLKRLWILLFYGNKEALPEVAIKKEKRKANDDVDSYGKWNTLHGLIGRLDSYHKDIKLMKKSDPDSYDIYKNIGGVIVPHSSGFYSDTVESTFNNRAFGAVQLSQKKDEKTDLILPRFIYFTKYNKFARVQLYRGELYRVAAMFEDKGIPVIAEAFCSLYDGKVTVLRQLVNCSNKGIPQKKWVYPSLVIKDTLKSKQDAEFLVTYAMNMIATSEDGFRVAAEKDGVVCSFYIDMLKTPNFFKSREPVLIDGKNKKIFHIVRTHSRILADGSKANVKSHFRGLRRFKWKGYKVTITMPAKHHSLISSFTSASFHRKRAGLVDGGTMSEKIKTHMEG